VIYPSSWVLGSPSAYARVMKMRKNMGKTLKDSKFGRERRKGQSSLASPLQALTVHKDLL
jgi:hypothetical protein